ncbi:MAG: uridine kinase family protein [Sulfobacillus sp.]
MKGRATLVAIDGMGGAGKTTLADAVLAHGPAPIALVHGDDFYRPEQAHWASWTPAEGYERYFDYQRLVQQLLEPLRGTTSARFQRYNWARNRLDSWVEVAGEGVVVVEGVYTLRPALRAYWDLAVYVHTPRSVRQHRLRQRAQNDPERIRRWSAAEDVYLRLADPAKAADVVVRGW